MGLIRSRSKKMRNKAEAEVLREQARQMRGDRREAERDAAVERAGGSVLRQPTVRDAIAAARRKRER